MESCSVGSGELTPLAQRALVSALQRTLQAAHPDAPVVLFETHISYVLVAGAQAYKLKKALNLGFLDFSRLGLRRQYCEEELRLNRRLAASLYLGVVPITGTLDSPVLGGEGPVLDYAVSMCAFAQTDLWGRMIERGALTNRHVVVLAELLAKMHRGAAAAPATDAAGHPQAVRAPVLDNLAALETLMTADADRAALRRLADWESVEFAGLGPVFTQRLLAGHVRECHGDLHLGNVVQFGSQVTVFDGIEFNEAFRWIDVIRDIAFMVMDLACYGRPDLGWRLLDAWLQRSGDYAGVRVLRYYLVDRALVRAKVAALREAQLQPSGAAMSRGRTLAGRYLDLALSYTHAAPAAMMITHGFSGSGKTTLTHGMVEAGEVIRIRADVERKRLHGLTALARPNEAVDSGVYSARASAATYARLYDLAQPVLAGGWRVLLDASFLSRAQRDQAARFAAARGVSFVILDFEVDKHTLRQRVIDRSARGDDASDADLAVLEAQFERAEPLGLDERPYTVRWLAASTPCHTRQLQPA